MRDEARKRKTKRERERERERERAKTKDGEVVKGVHKAISVERE